MGHQFLISPKCYHVQFEPLSVNIKLYNIKHIKQYILQITWKIHGAYFSLEKYEEAVSSLKRHHTGPAAGLVEGSSINQNVKSPKGWENIKVK